jgi:hypothetical protein
MHYFTRKTLTLAGVALVGAAVISGGVSSASAQPVAQISLSKINFSVTSLHAFPLPTGKLTDPGSIGPQGDASWSLSGPGGLSSPDEWDFAGGGGTTAYPSDGNFDPGYWVPGAYQATPAGAMYSSNGVANSVPQNTVTFYAKYGSLLGLSAWRSGQYVTVGAQSWHFDIYNCIPGYGYTACARWVYWPKRPISIEFLSGRTWKTAKTVISNSKGLVYYKFYAPSARSWRAQDGPTGTIWGNTSRTVSK